VFEADGVTYVHGKEIAAWLEQQPSSLSGGEIERIGQALGALPPA
jgi:ABC-type molybdate transport system ATPase subunit